MLSVLGSVKYIQLIYLVMEGSVCPGGTEAELCMFCSSSPPSARPHTCKARAVHAT